MSDLINPLQNLLDQAAELPDSGQVKKFAQRVTPSSRRASQTSILLLDISGSMGAVISGKRKIDILRGALNRPLEPDEMAFAFNSICEPIPDLRAIPDPLGGTALHFAIKAIKPHKPRQTLIVCDGKPDDPAQALSAARSLSGVINTLYIGPDSDRAAIEFMRQLARLGCGQSAVYDLRDGPILLGQAIQKLLPQGQG